MKKVLIITLAGFVLINYIGANPFAGGTGSKTDPFQISTAVQLDSVRNYLDSAFILINNIDLGITPYDTGIGWVPIGKSSAKFNGSFNGAGYIISNLYINRPASDHTGLFGYTNESTINNLGVINCNITGHKFTGSLVGVNNEISVVTNCYATGKILGTKGCVGGLVGYNSNSSSMSGCYAACEVTGEDYIGGLVGRNTPASVITNSYSTGKVSGASYIGGLAGYNYTSSIISDCYATGNVSGTVNYIGCLVGCNESSSQITNCYATGEATGAGSYIGGITGYNTSSTITNAYFNNETCRQNAGMGYDDNSQTVTGLTTTQMKQQSNFTGFDFSAVWALRPDTTYPALLLTDNAPFAFRDTLYVSSSVKLLNMLSNDYDYETFQNNLILKTDSLYGAGETNSVTWFSFPADTSAGYTDSLLYRVGEILVSGDTLWGNYAVAVLIKKANSAPVISSTAPTTATTGVKYKYTVIASDTDDDYLTYSLNNTPVGMSINDNIITWTPADNVTTSGEVTLTVSDGELSAEQSFTVTVSVTIGINEANETKNMFVYPNPVQAMLTVESESIVHKIEIYSVTGKQVLSEKVNNNDVVVDVQNLKKGTYILKLQTANGTEVRQLIKE